MDNQNSDTEPFEPIVVEHNYRQLEPIDKEVIKAFIRKCGCETASEVLKLDDYF